MAASRPAHGTSEAFMSLEHAIIRQQAPRMRAHQLQRTIQAEIAKGCSPHLFPYPVELEPPFLPVGCPSEATIHPLATPLSGASADYVRLRLWVSPEQKCDWHRSEQFLKQLSILDRRAAFEISGNRDGIRLGLNIPVEDASLVRAAFRSIFELCELEWDRNPILEQPCGRMDLRFLDFYPEPPYSHLVTTHEELKVTPFSSAMQVMSEIPESCIGFYQCVFQPAKRDNNWHRNVETLLDLEYELKLHAFGTATRGYLQQGPSGDLHGMASELDTKAHNDRPFFFAAIRTGVFRSELRARDFRRELALTLNLFQHGGRPFSSVSESHYADHSLDRFIEDGITFRPGFLVNSRELTGFVHMFHTPVVESRRLPVAALEILPVRNEELLEGTRIGSATYAGHRHNVCIPSSVRPLSTHIVAAPGMGKTTVLLNMLVQDIGEGYGIAFIDPHGDAVKRLCDLLPREQLERVIYMRPGDPDWTPLWNPLAPEPGRDIYRHVDDTIGTFKRIFTDWGDRLEHVIRNGLIGLSFLERTSMLDLLDLVRQSSPESDELRKQIVQHCPDGPVRRFWDVDFLKDYRKTEVVSPKHKISKLVSGGPVSLMLSQHESRIHFRQILDEGMILLVDLSSLGSEQLEIIGSMVLSSLLTTSLGRSDTDISKRKKFTIYADEAHRLVGTDTIENVLAETRKFGVNLVMAHQYLSQLDVGKVDALSGVGCTIMGRLAKRDSQAFANHLQDVVAPKELMMLKPREMIVRVGSDVVKFETVLPPVPTDAAGLDGVLEASRRAYYRSADEIRTELLGQRPSHSIPASAFDELGWTFTPEELAYDEF